MQHKKQTDPVTILIERGTREALKKRGKKGETYDEIIMRLLELEEK